MYLFNIIWIGLTWSRSKRKLITILQFYSTLLILYTTIVFNLNQKLANERRYRDCHGGGGRVRGVVVVGEDGSHPRRRHCRHGHRSRGGRRLASTLASASLSSLPPRPSSSWKQTARVTVVVATAAIIIADVLFIMVGVKHGSSLRW